MKANNQTWSTWDTSTDAFKGVHTSASPHGRLGGGLDLFSRRNSDGECDDIVADSYGTSGHNAPLSSDDPAARNVASTLGALSGFNEMDTVRAPPPRSGIPQPRHAQTRGGKPHEPSSGGTWTISDRHGANAAGGSQAYLNRPGSNFRSSAPMYAARRSGGGGRDGGTSRMGQPPPPQYTSPNSTFPNRFPSAKAPAGHANHEADEDADPFSLAMGFSLDRLMPAADVPPDGQDADLPRQGSGWEVPGTRAPAPSDLYTNGNFLGFSTSFPNATQPNSFQGNGNTLSSLNVGEPAAQRSMESLNRAFSTAGAGTTASSFVNASTNNTPLQAHSASSTSLFSKLISGADGPDFAERAASGQLQQPSFTTEGGASSTFRSSSNTTMDQLTSEGSKGAPYVPPSSTRRSHMAEGLGGKQPMLSSATATPLSPSGATIRRGNHSGHASVPTTPSIRRSDDVTTPLAGRSQPHTPGADHRAQRASLTAPVVTKSSIGEVCRGTPSSLERMERIRQVHDQSSCALWRAPEWPPSCASEVKTLLQNRKALTLQRHLTIISFSRQRVREVQDLFNVWASSGIPAPDMGFGAYYYYVKEKSEKQLCMKHNGRGITPGHGYGKCDFESRRPNSKCRYEHMCLFCRSDDHGWFEEGRCKSYQDLLNEMEELGVTQDDVNLLLDAMEKEEKKTVWKRTA